MVLQVKGNSVIVFDGPSGRIISSMDFTSWGGVESANVSGDNYFVRTKNGPTVVLNEHSQILNSYS